MNKNVKQYDVDKEKKMLMNVINKALSKNKFEKTLSAISVYCNLMYEWNQSYYDQFIEDSILRLSELTCERDIRDFKPNLGTVLFYDGFGMDTRGLAYIYIKGILSIGYKLIYVTKFKGNGLQPEIDKILENNEHEKIYLDDSKGYLHELRKLQKIIIDNKPEKAFLYTTPFDSVGITAFTQISGIDRFKINLTDHAFWAGLNTFDYCIEFREYGAVISNQYRCINKDKEVLLPYYPIINKDIAFEGFPFDFHGKNILFSGGALYKTIDEAGTYYFIVESLLKDNENLIFIYAGSGDDSRLNEVINKFPERVFHINERKDLYQIMRHITLYLNTYPMIGGLMTQYAAIAGKIPVTLRHNNDGDGILIDQRERKIEYDDKMELIRDVNQLITNKNYLRERERLLNNCIITDQDFNDQLASIINMHSSKFNIDYYELDVREFIKDYIDRFDIGRFRESVAKKQNKFLYLKYFHIYVKKICRKGYRMLSRKRS